MVERETVISAVRLVLFSVEVMSLLIKLLAVAVELPLVIELAISLMIFVTGDDVFDCDVKDEIILIIFNKEIIEVSLKLLSDDCTFRKTLDAGALVLDDDEIDELISLKTLRVLFEVLD